MATWSDLLSWSMGTVLFVFLIVAVYSDQAKGEPHESWKPLLRTIGYAQVLVALFWIIARGTPTGPFTYSDLP